jgi:hypothetical protein
MIVIALILAIVAIVAATVSLGCSHSGESKAYCQAEGACRFHYSTHQCFADKRNNAADNLTLAYGVYANVRNCCRGLAGVGCETMPLLHQFVFSPIVENQKAEMKKGLALTRPSIKIAGAQEGTRTPTELPAST